MSSDFKNSEINDTFKEILRLSRSGEIKRNTIHAELDKRVTDLVRKNRGVDYSIPCRTTYHRYVTEADNPDQVAKHCYKKTFSPEGFAELKALVAKYSVPTDSNAANDEQPILQKIWNFIKKI